MPGGLGGGPPQSGKFCVIAVAIHCALFAFFPGSQLLAGEQVVYLTFDDGPRNGTQEILKVLTREKTPATFYLIGEHVKIGPSRQETVRLLEESPWTQIANHSFSHARQRYQAFYDDPEWMLKDFKQNNEVLGFDHPPYYIRLPSRMEWRFDDLWVDNIYYPKANKKPVSPGVAKLFENGFVIHGWDVEWNRSYKTGVMESVEKVLSELRQKLANGQSVKPGKVVLLMHDQNFKGKAEQIGDLIQALKKDGVEFDLMGNY